MRLIAWIATVVTSFSQNVVSETHYQNTYAETHKRMLYIDIERIIESIELFVKYLSVYKSVRIGL